MNPTFRPEKVTNEQIQGALEALRGHDIVHLKRWADKLKETDGERWAIGEALFLLISHALCLTNTEGVE